MDEKNERKWVRRQACSLVRSMKEKEEKFNGTHLLLLHFSFSNFCFFACYQKSICCCCFFSSLLHHHHQIANYLILQCCSQFFLAFFSISSSFIHWLHTNRISNNNNNKSEPLDRAIAVPWLLISSIQVFLFSLFHRFCLLVVTHNFYVYIHFFNSILIKTSFSSISAL